MTAFLGSIISSIKQVIKLLGNFGNVISGLLGGLLEYIFAIFYYIFLGISSVLCVIQILFYKMAGVGEGSLGTVYVSGSPTDNLVLGFLFSSQVVNAFISMLILSVILLIVFTFIAIIKSEFALDLKGSAKGPIIARAFKALAYFIAVPVTSVFGIYAIQGLTKTLFQMTGGEGSQALFIKCFNVGAYEANRARYDQEFYERLNAGWNNNGGDFTGSTADELAAKIDSAFINGLAIKKTELKSQYLGSDGSVVVNQDDIDFEGDYFVHAKWTARAIGDIDSHLLIWVYPENEVSGSMTYSPFKVGLIHYYYDMVDFNYILMIGSLIVLTYYMLMTTVGLIKRVFDITILMLISPAMIALEPLDDGAARKKWVKEMYSRVISVAAAVFAMNMFFLLVPVFSTVSLFGTSKSATGAVQAVGSSIVGTTTSSSMGVIGATIILTILSPLIVDAIFQVFVIIMGSMVVKNASAMVSSMLGANDLIKEGTDMAKSVGQTAAKGIKMVGGGIGLAKGLGAKMGLGKEGKAMKDEADQSGKDAVAALGENASQEEKDAAYKKAYDASMKKSQGKANVRIAGNFATMTGWQSVAAINDVKKNLKDQADAPNKEREDAMKAERLKMSGDRRIQEQDRASSQAAAARDKAKAVNAEARTLVDQNGNEDTLAAINNAQAIAAQSDDETNRRFDKLESARTKRGKAKQTRKLNKYESDLEEQVAAIGDRSGDELTGDEVESIVQLRAVRARQYQEALSQKDAEGNDAPDITAAAKIQVEITNLSKKLDEGENAPDMFYMNDLSQMTDNAQQRVERAAQMEATMKNMIEQFRALTQDLKASPEEMNNAIARLEALQKEYNGNATSSTSKSLEETAKELQRVLDEAKKK